MLTDTTHNADSPFRIRYEDPVSVSSFALSGPLNVDSCGHNKAVVIILVVASGVRVVIIIIVSLAPSLSYDRSLHCVLVINVKIEMY